MKYFLQLAYRVTPDGSLSLFGQEHLLFIFLCLTVVFLVSTMKIEKLGTIRKVLLGALIFDICNRYGFYLTTGYTGLKESLPLYHCRLVALLSIIYLIRPNKKTGTLIYYWGLMGGLASLVYPMPDPFAFPHILLFLFFMYHTVLFTMSVIVYRDGNWSGELNNVRKITLLYNIFLAIINIFLESNYGMVTIPPVAKELLLSAGPLVYTIIAIGVYDLLICCIYKGTKEFQRIEFKSLANQ